MFKNLKPAWKIAQSAAQFYKTTSFTRFLRLLRLRIFHKYNIGNAAFYGFLDPHYKIDKNMPWSSRRFEILYEVLSPRSKMALVDDKIKLALTCAKKGIQCPSTVGYMDKSGSFFLLNNSVYKQCELLDFVEKLPTKFVSKPQFGMGGQDVYLYRKLENKISNTQWGDFSKQAFIEYLNTTYSGRNVLFQKTETNHPELEKLISTQTLGTCRVVTLIQKTGKIEIIMAYLKFPGQNEETDNFGMGDEGQLTSNIDFNTGVLKDGVGVHASGFGIRKEGTHSKTGITITGSQIPYWNEAKKLALKSAEAIPELRAIGWDIAITPEGPSIIEGNTRSALPNDPLLLNSIKDKLVDACD